MSVNNFFIHQITKDIYNDNIERIARELRLSAGSYKAKDEIIFDVIKSRVSRIPDFIKFYKCCTKNDSQTIKTVLCCLIAGFYANLQQDQLAHSDYTGSGSQTYSFSVDLGTAMDRNNEWLKLAYSLMGKNNPSRIKVRSVGI